MVPLCLCDVVTLASSTNRALFCWLTMWIYRQQFLFVPDLKGSLPFSTTLTQSIHGMWAINLDVMFHCRARYRAERDSLLCACPNIIFYDTGGVMVIRRWNGDVAPVSIVRTTVTRHIHVHSWREQWSMLLWPSKLLFWLLAQEWSTPSSTPKMELELVGICIATSRPAIL